MAPRTPKPAPATEPGSEPDLDTAAGSATTPAPDPDPEPRTPAEAGAVTPPDRDADGHPGGSDALHPCAVLLAPLGALASGLIVCGPRAAIAALVDASAARMATPTDLAIAGGITRPLPTEI